uniref:Uncharacterized protein n=1 Tax=candidate division WOR-3 bacterium TaxID=2052148 RepID=A0A7V4E499_UNCW3
MKERFIPIDELEMSATLLNKTNTETIGRKVKVKKMTLDSFVNENNVDYTKIAAYNFPDDIKTIPELVLLIVVKKERWF